MTKNNPLNYVTKKDIKELGLSEEEISEAYQPSAGGVFHARGAESMGKTLWCADFYKYLIDIGKFTPFDAVGNLTFKGKYGIGYQTLKGDNLRQYLWDLTHKPYTNKIVFIDEIDSEFPARSFSDKEQTEIALRLWHTAKLGNYIFMTSHLGNSTDLIIHLASHYMIFPDAPDFETNSMDFMIASALDFTFEEYTVYDIIKSMLIYNRKELTEETEEEQNKIRPSLIKKSKKAKEENNHNGNFDINDAEEFEVLNLY